MGKRITVLSTIIFALAVGSALAADSPVKGPFAQAVHATGSVTYKDASQKSWTWDRGKISALSATSITLTRRDKVDVSFALTSSTVVRNDHGTYALADLKVGQAATVISQSGNAVIIRNIRGEGAPSGADQSTIEGPGYESVTGTIDLQYVDGSHQAYDYNRGRITVLGDSSLTITRADGQTVTLTYDSSTIVREQGERYSASDLKVGEGAMFFSQNGALKLVRCVSKPHGDSEAKSNNKTGDKRPHHGKRPVRPGAQVSASSSVSVS